MKPINFEESNQTLGEDQPEYLALHVHRYSGHPSIVVSCWKMTFLERFKTLFTGKIWVNMMTFKKKPMPIRLDVDKPRMRKLQ